VGVLYWSTSIQKSNLFILKISYTLSRIKSVKTSAVLLAVLLAVSLAAASVSLTPTTIYETNTVWEVIDVNNYGESSVITSVEVSSPDIEVTDAKSYSGWSTSYDSDSAAWTDGSIATNVQSAWFEFEVTAPNISSDYTAIVTVITDSDAVQFNLSVLNDATPPDITNVTPSDYAAANNPSQAILVTITDDETGVTDATYTWNDCNGGNDTSVTLTKAGDTFSGTADFSGYDEGDKACYTIKAKNNAGEEATLTGEITFDGTPPGVTLLAPSTYATESTTFMFNATDNIAISLTCTVKVEGNELITVAAANNSITTTTQDLSNFTEGNTIWSVTCLDGVGLSATGEKAIILDTAAPIVDYNSINYLLRTQAAEFTVTVTDTVSVANVDVTFDGSTVNLTQNGDDYTGSIESDTLGDKDLVITATDDAGHVTTYSKTITTVPNHQLSLDLSPSSSDPGDSITASGTLTADGSATGTEVTLKTPGGDYTVDFRRLLHLLLCRQSISTRQILARC